MLRKNAANARRELLQPKAIFTCWASFAIGLFYALIYPNLSYFLTHELKVRPLLVGAFFLGLSVSSIVFAQVLAIWSDKKKERALIIACGMLSGCLACVVFASSTSYLVVLAAALILLGGSTVSPSQILALAREYSDQHFPKQLSALFNAVTRASFAMAWVLGPPLGFIVISQFSFSYLYAACAICYLFIAFVSLRFLPKKRGSESQAETHSKGRLRLNRQCLIAALACALLFSVNHGYLIALPMYLEQHILVDAKQAGWVMGFAAALEIPLMLMGGVLASRYSILPFLKLAAVCAALLCFGMWLANSIWQVYFLQVFNAIFIACLTAIGITWFQNAMPEHVGSASALFFNTTSVGNIIGSITLGLVADTFSYHSIYLINVGFALLALALFYFCDEH